MPLTRQVCSSEYRFALASAPACVSANSPLRPPMTNGRIAFSHLRGNAACQPALDAARARSIERVLTTCSRHRPQSESHGLQAVAFRSPKESGHVQPNPADRRRLLGRSERQPRPRGRQFAYELRQFINTSREGERGHASLALIDDFEKACGDPEASSASGQRSSGSD